MTNLRPASTLLLLIAAAMTSPLSAAPPTDVLNKYACSGCHSIDKKIVGPAFSEVAAKYKDQKDAKEHLSTRIRSGGSGIWGAVPMPPQPAIADDELAKVVDWLVDGAKP